MSLGERLKAIRGKRTQLDFSSDLGISKSTYVRYERGQRIPDADLLKAICCKFEVRPEWLLLGEGDSRQPKIKLQVGHDLPWPTKEGASLDMAGLLFSLFIMQKTPESFRQLPNDRQDLMMTFLWDLVHRLPNEELIILQSCIHAWLDQWREQEATEG